MVVFVHAYLILLLRYYTTLRHDVFDKYHLMALVYVSRFDIKTVLHQPILFKHKFSDRKKRLLPQFIHFCMVPTIQYQYQSGDLVSLT